MADQETSNPAAAPGFDRDSQHPQYRQWTATWQKLRDCYDGDEAIKGAGETYLPMPSGMTQAVNPTAAYSAYVLRAEVPDLVAPTVRGLAGVIHRKPAIYEMPEQMTVIEERATRPVQALDAFHRRVTREVLLMGRYGILADAPEGGGEPFLAGYTAEAIEDWDIDEDGKLVFLKLNESGDRRDPVTGGWSELNRWRVCSIEGGRYTVTIYDGDTGDGVQVQPVDGKRQPLTEIPFVFVDTNDLLPEPDEAPLYGVAKAQLSIYRVDADYRHALFLTAQPTPVAIGVEDAENAPKFIGSSAIWALPQGGDAKMLEFQGTGVDAMRKAKDDDFNRAVMAGVALMSPEQGEAESGEALRIRRASQTATITPISQNVASGLEAALRHVALMKGLDPEAVIVTPNLDFVESRMTPEEKAGLIEAWLKGAISRQTLFWNLQRGEVIPEDREYEEEVELIDSEAPGLGLLGLNEPGGSQTGANDDLDEEEDGAGQGA